MSNTGSADRRESVRGVVARRLALMGLACMLTDCSGCLKPAQSADPTAPTGLSMSWFERQGGGKQGAQRSVGAGGQAAVPGSWLGSTKANIRIYAYDPEGIRVLEVAGAATGRCYTKDGTYGQVGLNTSFPPQNQTAPAGQVWDESTSISLDDVLGQEHSCGTHVYANMPSRQEFFFETGTWTLTVKSENCCGGTTTGIFYVKIE